MDRREQNGTPQVPAHARSRPRFANREGGQTAARDDAVPQETEGGGRSARSGDGLILSTCVRKSANTARRVRAPQPNRNNMRIQTFDTTLRDGTQGEAVSFSLDDKLVIAQKLDELGIDYIEGGWPNSNPKDKEFFQRARSLKLKHARLTAFGSTRFSKNKTEQDPNVRALLEAETPTISIFGKSWDLHVHRALGIQEEENLKLISETVKYLKDNGREVVYDAEHFFDGFNANPDFALRTLEAAKQAGADVLCLCDTNGGNLTHRIIEVVAEVRKRFDGVLGIHTHNDCDVAVANTIAAVEAR